MASDYTITITTLSAGLYAPNTTLDGKATLQATGSPSIKVTGSHLGNGTYKFASVDDGKYKLFEDVACTSEITKWGGTNGKWIGDDLMEYYAASADLANVKSLTAGLKTSITNLESATASIVSGMTGYSTLSGTNTFSAKNTFNNGITVSGSTTAYNQIYNLTNFQSTCPVVSVDPTTQNGLTRKLYVDNAIASIAVGTTASSQQSINIRRLVPAGFNETNRLYTTWGTAVANAGSYASSAQQYTVLVEGEGNTGDKINLPVHTPSTDEVFHDYVHVRGMGSDLKIYMNSSEVSTISASVIGRIVFEDLYFYGAADLTQVFKNMIFKNCKFNGTAETDPPFYFAFQNCIFEGTNYFIGSMPTFTSCSGTRVFTETVPTVAGSTILPYYTSNQMNIGAITLTGVTGSLRLSAGLSTSGSLAFNAINTSAPTAAGSAPTLTDYYGNDSKALTDPDAWLNLTVNGASYAIPLYEK